MSDLFAKISSLKQKLADRVVILGHHYQKDEIIQFCDHQGDSLELAKMAAKEQKEFIIFCGVHFMAETADMITRPQQKVILPVTEAGCSMADMADLPQVQNAWEIIHRATSEKVIPVTYINCKAELKAFVGHHGGSICTSSNAEKIISWALNSGDKLIFFPDQHLGRNTCYKLGIPLDQMITYDPLLPDGGVTAEAIRQAKVILWQGYCCVHQGFHPNRMKEIKRFSPETIIIVHPECYFDAVQAADLSGSTSFIVKTVEQPPPGSRFAIGTEANLFQRKKQRFPNKFINSITDEGRFCRTMNMIEAKHLLATLEAIDAGNPQGIISVDQELHAPSLLALDRMFTIGK